jgi:hypothetical protein
MQHTKPQSSLLQVGRVTIAAAWLLAPVLLAPVLLAGEPPVTTIEFAPRVVTKLRGYGEDEAAALRSAIVAAVSRESGRVAIPANLAVTVVMQDIAPTHPTRKQLSDDPAVDPVRTRYLGGAELVGYLRDANQHVVATITHHHFALTLVQGSASLDAWADARLAIDQFAAKLAAACRDLAVVPTAGS